MDVIEPEAYGLNLKRAAKHNREAVLLTVQRHEPIARRQIADLLGLSNPAVANITNELVESGLLVTTRRRGGRGQPAMLFQASEPRLLPESGTQPAGGKVDVGPALR